MLFSAYQIESLLEDIQHDIFPTEKSISENLSFSEDAIKEAKQYLRPPKKRALAWIYPNVKDSTADIKISVLSRISADDRTDDLKEESADKLTPADLKEFNTSTQTESGVSAASLFYGIELEDDQDEGFDSDSGGLQGDIDDDSDVVFGDGRIEKKSMIKFVNNYPDSTIKFLLRKNMDGRPLPNGYDEIYLNWENRGLSRMQLKKYLFKLMEWEDFPDIPILEVVRKIRERHFDLKEKIHERKKI